MASNCSGTAERRGRRRTADPPVIVTPPNDRSSSAKPASMPAPMSDQLSGDKTSGANLAEVVGREPTALAAGCVERSGRRPCHANRPSRSTSVSDGSIDVAEVGRALNAAGRDEPLDATQIEVPARIGVGQPWSRISPPQRLQRKQSAGQDERPPGRQEANADAVRDRHRVDDAHECRGPGVDRPAGRRSVLVAHRQDDRRSEVDRRHPVAGLGSPEQRCASGEGGQQLEQAGRCGGSPGVIDGVQDVADGTMRTGTDVARASSSASCFTTS